LENPRNGWIRIASKLHEENYGAQA
jgi:hypothetical protein